MSSPSTTSAATPVPYHGTLPDIYELGDVFAQGGMGALINVSSPDGTPLLLKRIPEGKATSVITNERFKLEIINTVELSIKLRDLESVPRIYAWDEKIDGPYQYLLMEKIEGPTLIEAIQDWSGATHADRLRRSLQITQSICKTLEAIHAEGKVHRDITPRNILLRPNGKPVLIDFGLSKNLDADPNAAQLTLGHDCIGTPRYKPPELEIADSDFSPRGDLFAVGLLLFEMLTGRPARDCEEIEAIRRQVLLEDPPDVRKLADWIPASVAKMVAALLARNPKDRYVSASSLICDLQALLDNSDATLALQERPLARAKRAWMRKSAKARSMAIKAAGATALVTGLIVGTWVGLPHLLASQAAATTHHDQAIPLLGWASHINTSGALLLQKSFSEAAFYDTQAAEASLIRLSQEPGYENTGKALLAWFARASSPTQELKLGWQYSDKDLYGLAWVMPALNTSVSEHPNDAWLLAWRAWVELSFYDNLKAQADLAAARSLAPKAGLIRRFEFLARLGFGFSDRLWTYVEKNEAECPPSELGEWALWRAVMHRRDGNYEKASQALARALERMPADDLLLPRVWAEKRYLHALRELKPHDAEVPPEPLATNDPLTFLLHGKADALQFGQATQRELPMGLSMEMCHTQLLGQWARFFNADPKKVILPQGAGLTADFTGWGGLLHSFKFSGDSDLVVFQDNVLKLLQAEGDLRNASRTSPKFLSKTNPFPPQGDWLFTAKVKWSRKGDYGSGISLGPIALYHDIAFRVHLPDGQTHIESTPGWHSFQIERVGNDLHVSFDNKPIGPKLDATKVLPDRVGISTFGPTVSGEFEISELSIKLRD